MTNQYHRTNWHQAVRREHQIVTSRVGIIDLTPFAKFIVKGKEARKYLDYLVAGTVPKEGRGAIQSVVISLKLELYQETSNKMC